MLPQAPRFGPRDFPHRVRRRVQRAERLDAAAAAQLLPRLADAEATEAVLQRHPLVRGASGLVCTGTAENRQAWCSMLRDLFSASGAAARERRSSSSRVPRVQAVLQVRARARVRDYIPCP